MSVLEAILASALFMLVATAIITLLLQSLGSNRLSNEQTIANQYASEGIEAVRDIRNRSYASLTATTSAGVAISNGVWAFSGASTTFDKYTRVIAISSVQRDASGNIVSSGGTVDPNTMKASSTVSWNTSPTRVDSVALVEYFTKWRAPIVSTGGMLVYGDGGTATDTISYKVFDGTGWSATGTVSDVSTTTTNQATRAVRIYSNPTTTEKILLSRHYNGTTQYIYEQVYNATTTTWGNVQLLASWTAATYLDVQNFGGAYLSNGTFVAVYSDNTNIPKSRVWNGVAWSGQTSLTGLGVATQIPTYIVAKSRPGTNEIMGAFFTQASSTITQYYSGAAWSATTTHSTTSPLLTKRFVDFEWSPNSTTTGALAYTTGVAAKSIYAKMWVANGAGSGAWGAGVASAAQTNTLGAIDITARGGANEFQMCNKDALATPTIVCYKVTFAGNVATVVTPTNNSIAAATDVGIQRSYHLGFEKSGITGIGIYSDNTAVPKFKKYTPTTSTWDASATTISTAPYALGVVKSVRVIPSSQIDDMMALMVDANLDLYSVMWDGTNNIMYTTPVGKAFSQYGLNGSATTDFWYDFTWDLP